MGRPFGEDLAAEPFDLVFKNLDPVVQDVIDGLRGLAELFGSGPQTTVRAVATNLEHARADSEIAVSALLAGVGVIFERYRESFATVGAGLSMQVDALTARWSIYGDTGQWTPPPRRELPRIEPPQVAIITSGPRAPAHGERITADATKSMIDIALTIVKNLANSSHNVFGSLVRNVLPVGELMDTLDTAAVDHAKAFANLHETLADSVRRLVEVVETSTAAYQQTGLWNAPTAAIGS